MIKVDAEGRFQFVSPAYCHLFDKTEEELLGWSFMPPVHEGDRESTARAMVNLYHPPYSVYLKQRAMAREGWRWLGWMDTAVLDKDRNITVIIGVGRDITQRKLTEQALRESEAKFRSGYGASLPDAGEDNPTLRSFPRRPS